ncbi:MAG: hypothetical protein E7446_05675 [Ruminococcaceae bacterium]|nr:hypothetical protein [Oscillospiraceae bacterium]
MKRIPWAELRSRYENGGETYRSLGEAYGLSEDCVGRRARAEGWRRGRKNGMEECLAQVVGALRTAAQQATQQAEGMSPKELKEMTGVLRELMQLQQMLQSEDKSGAESDTVQVVLEGEAEAWSR